MRLCRNIRYNAGFQIAVPAPILPLARPMIPDDCPGRVDLRSLLQQFYSRTSDLAEFQPVQRVPAPFDELLDHDAHMTVTVERFHGQSVDVVVHQAVGTDRQGHALTGLTSDSYRDWADQLATYTREITLVTQQSNVLVQYGIVRLHCAMLRRSVWHEIASGKTPLGRVLIENDVLRKVGLCQLWEVLPGPRLCHILDVPPSVVTYGRTARIHLDGRPAIELLEIVRVDG